MEDLTGPNVLIDMEESRERFWEKELSQGRLEVVRMKASVGTFTGKNPRKEYYRILWFRNHRRMQIGDMEMDGTFVSNQKAAGILMEPGVKEALQDLRRMIDVKYVMES